MNAPAAPQHTPSVDAFLDGVEPERKQREAHELNALFKRVTGWKPRMWGAALVGYGSYHYKYDSGREGDSLATGFSPRKAKHSLYIMPGYADFGPILERLGKHTLGKACLYINRLDDIDMTVLEELIQAGLNNLAKQHEITAS